MCRKYILATYCVILINVTFALAESNDTPAGATLLTANADPFLSQVTESDTDWYKVTVTGPGIIDYWRVSSLSGGAYLGVTAYVTADSYSGSFIQSSTSPGNSAQTGSISVPSGTHTYYAFVLESSSFPAGNGYYRISVSFTQPQDTTPPLPNPSQWLQQPYATSDTSIYMSCQLESDIGRGDHDPCQYYFHFLSGSGGHSSGWINENTWTDTGLTPNSSYGYEVYAQDSVGNQTTAAAQRSAYTLAAIPPQPTVGNPTSPKTSEQ